METPSKYCPDCGHNKPLADFHKDKCRKDGYHIYCKIHHNLRQKQYTDKNRKKINNQKLYRRQTHTNRKKLLEYLQNHPCVDCGETDVIVLEFDHLSDKKYNVARLVATSSTWTKIETEIRKCEVVCANCHRRRTAKKFNYWKNGV